MIIDGVALFSRKGSFISWTQSFLPYLLVFSAISTLPSATAWIIPSISAPCSQFFLSTATRKSSFYEPSYLRPIRSLSRVSPDIKSNQLLFSSRISAGDSSSMSSTEENFIIPGRPTWQQTMIRVRDPTSSLEFYTKQLGMTLIDSLDFPQYKFTVYFVTTLPADEIYSLTPGTKEAHNYLWNMEGTAIELTHNYGTELPDNTDFKGYHPGNQEKDGFGHIAINVDDVYAKCDKLEKAGYSFKKKPDEGRMKGIAFVYDPDGYWVEIIQRGTNCQHGMECNFSQTMLRIKDPKKSLSFYQQFGMKLLRESHYDDFSLYFLGSSNVNVNTDMKDLFSPVLELTHNHGTEVDDSFRHYNGNEDGRQGFGHIGFLVDDVYAACDAIRPMGYGFRKEPDGGSMKGLAFCYDPDGYSVELIKRGGIDFGDAQKESR